MKRLNILLFGLAIVALLSVSCDRDEVLYNGPEYVMFADTISQYGITDEEDNAFEVVIASTVSCDYDRRFAVEVVDNGSTAIEGVHYTISNNNVVIKAGERAAKVALNGIYDNINVEDSIGVVLRLVSNDKVKWDLYNDITKVVFMKCCPFSLEDFVDDGANYIFYASFPYESVTRSLVKAEKLDNNRLIFRDLFTVGDNIKMQFNYSDPLSPTVKVLEQIAITAGNTGKIMAATNSYVPSYFYPCQKFINFYLDVYLDDNRVFGTYQYMLEWISEDKAEYIRNNGFGL